MAGRMHAAVVTSFEDPPRYLEVDVPQARGEQFMVEMLAAGLHPRVRSGASGTHYSSTGRLPLVPGVDGVGRRADGRLVYFVANDTAVGTMAERAVVEPGRSVELPADVDVTAIAAAMNPAMSSWVALRRRTPLQAGQSVLVLGATGNAGTMAVSIAKLLGAGRVVGAGRDTARLERLRACGADELVPLTGDQDADAEALGAATAEVDVVVDYLWGAPTSAAIPALLSRRSDRSRALDWIEVGSVAGPTIELPSAALRSAHLRLLGSGQGSVSGREYAAELPSLVAAIADGSVPVEARQRPLIDVERVWNEPEIPGIRIVLRP